MQPPQLRVGRDRRSSRRQAEHQRRVAPPASRATRRRQRARDVVGRVEDLGSSPGLDVRRDRDRCPCAAAIASRTAPTAGSTSAAGRRCAAPPPTAAPSTSRRQPRHAAEDAAGEHGRKRLAAHAQPGDHRRRGRGELAAGARQDLRPRPRRRRRSPAAPARRVPRSPVAAGRGSRSRESARSGWRAACGPGPCPSAASPDRGRRTAGRPPTAPRGRSRSRRLRRRAGSPSRRRAPPARRVAPVRDRAGAGDDDHAGLVAGAGDERHQRVVDDQRLRLEADAAHDAANGVGVVGPIDAGDAQADGGGTDVGHSIRCWASAASIT